MQFGQNFGPGNAMQQGGSPGGFARDLTGADLSSHMGPVKASGGLNIAFFYTKVRLKTKNAKKNGKVETRLCVAKQPKGDRFTTAVQFISPEQASQQFPREFAMFQQYEEVPTTGTPISELPGMSQSQIGIMLINGIRSVEDLCEVSEDLVAQMGLDAARSQRLAKQWLAKAQGEADQIRVAEVEAAADAERRALMERLERLEEHAKRLEMQNEALRSNAGGQQGSAAPQAIGPDGAVAVESKDDLPYDVSQFDDDDVFGGSEVVTDGNDDLGGDEIDPLQE